MTEYSQHTALIELIWPRSEGQPVSRSQGHPTTEDKPAESSGSGIVLSPEHGFILTHASILGPYFSDHPDICEHIKQEHNYKNLDALPLKVKVHLQSGYIKNDAKRDVKSSKSWTSRLFGIDWNSQKTLPLTSSKTNNNNLVRTQMCSVRGKLHSLFRVNSFATAMDKIMPQSEGWSTTDESEKSSDKTEEQPDMSFLLPYLLLIKTEPQMDIPNNIQIIPSSQISRGNIVTITGTPFGALSPEIFMNSVSEGVISNTAGENNALILTDARCMPGSEGGAVCMKNMNNSRSGLLGIVVAPLCWKQNEWIGLSIVCSLSEALTALKTQHMMPNRISSYSKLKEQRSLSSCAASVVLVKAGSSWGSGNVIHPGTGLILTCSHVVRGAISNTAAVRLGKHRWTAADIIYASQAGEVFDIAVLKLRKPQHVRNIQQYGPDLNPRRGQRVTVVGHALFTGEKDMAPSWSRGVVANVTDCGGKPVMVQTTCMVHAGASGGPAISADGKLVAMVTCNARDNDTKASYPHVNLAVPMATVWPVIEEYIQSNNPEVLDKLTLHNEKVKKLWTLPTQESGAVLKSQL